MRGLTKTLKFGDHEIVVREPSMIEVRNWLEGAIAPITDSLTRLAFEGRDEAYLATLPLLVGKSSDELQSELDLRFSEMREILGAAKEVAPDFFATLDRLLDLGREQTPPAKSKGTSRP